MGNRTYSIINRVHTAYSYDNNDRLTQQGGVSYSYDANGNTLTESEDGQVTRYHYDARNKLIGVEKPGLTAIYGYNADGIRTRKTENGQITNYVVDSNRDYAQVLAEVTNSTIEVSYTYGDDLVSQTRGADTSYYLYDGHGSTRALADSSGSLTDSYDYDAFGVELHSEGSTENAYRYTGEQLDQNLDQYYLRARYYDQNAGRFTQMDTWMGVKNIPFSLNKYLYTEGDPTNNIDPSGNFLVSLNVRTTIRATLAATATQVPRLGVTFLTGAGGQLVGIAATTCGANYAATHFGIVMPSSEFKGCDGSGYEGRWQAQGGGVQESESWSQPMPLTLTKGLALLNMLEANLKPKDRKMRAPFFERARLFAKKLASVGGISAANFGGSKSFPRRNQPGSYPRVDLEINRGHAFTNE